MTGLQPRRIPHETRQNIKINLLIIAGLSATFFSTLVVGGIVCFLFLPTAAGSLIPILGLLAIAATFMGVMLPYSLAKGEMMTRKAQALAKKRLGPGGKTTLNIIETALEPTITGGELVMNDWGLVYLEAGKRPIELSWQDIEKVEEPSPMRITVHGKGRKPFVIVPTRYYLVAAAMFEKLPHRTQFDVNPISGESRLVDKLNAEPRSWGKYKLDANGIKWDKDSVRWDEIQSVREMIFETNEGTSHKELEVKGFAKSFRIHEADGNDDTYSIVKAIMEDRLPSNKCEFEYKGPSAMGRAVLEFDRMAETTRVGMKTARVTHKYEHLESYFAHMQTLVETFSLEGRDVDKFRIDYADVLQYTGRTDEANALLKQVD